MNTLNKQDNPGREYPEWTHPRKQEKENDPSRLRPGTKEPEREDPTRISPGRENPPIEEPEKTEPERAVPAKLSTTIHSMKTKLIYSAVIAGLLWSAPLNTHASAVVPSTKATHERVLTEEERAEGQILMKRLTVIKDMDKSHLTVKEKKELRKEVRGIRDRLHAIYGVWISAGALIIILILLILLV